MTKEKLQELLAKARAQAEAAKQKQVAEAAAKLQEQVAAVDEVDTSKLGITDEQLKTDVGQDQAVDTIREVIENAVARDGGSLQSDTKQTVSSTDGALPQDKAEADKTDNTSRVGVARNVILNEKQQLFADTVAAGTDCVLIGAAGTGKTTSMKKTMLQLLATGRVKNLGESTKWLQAGMPGIAVCSYTRKAVNNICHAMPDELKQHTLTIHKLLEFAPIWYEVENPEKPGTYKTTMRFEPTRTRLNPLPASLGAIAFEEGSMVSVELHNMLLDACAQKPQLIYLGDIQQLPPIFGLAILGFKMLELPVVELTEVYRQALESPIISLAWKILEGNPHVFSSKVERYKTESKISKKQVERIKVPALEVFNKTTDSGRVFMQPWQKQLSADNGLNTATKQFCAWSDDGYYDPQEDIILIPFNKAFGTIELNKGIMQYLGTKREAVVHEVIAGYNKHYLAVGDRVLYDKEDAFIIDIANNTEYVGKRAMAPSRKLDRWGHYREDLSAAEVAKLEEEESSFDLEAVEKFMELAADEIEDRANAASHIITVRISHSDEDVELESAAEINNLLGGYAITVHKAQGSEWNRVFFVMHNTHAVMNQRELLYTAVTRARNFLHVICEIDTFFKGVKSQKIKGNTLQEKAEWFKGKSNDVQKKLELSQLAAQAAQQRDTPQTTISGKPAIKLEDLVPMAVKETT